MNEHETVTASNGGGLSPEQRQRADAELTRVLDSEAFHSSKRCREFLQFIVGRKLQGRDDLLKERTIGVELFGRSPDYEPNSDAIVRVRATEVRKRLAQHYDHAGSLSTVRIELPPGSYIPEFRWEPVESPVTAATTGGKRKPWRLVLVLGLLLTTALFGLWQWKAQRTGILEEFWREALMSPKPVLICLRQPVVYHLKYRVHEGYLKTNPPGNFPSPYVLPLKPGDVKVSDIVPVPDQYVSIGCARAAARITAMLATRKKLSQMRSGDDFSFVDLKDFPTVMVGAVPHGWTEKLTNHLPFILVQEEGLRGIREQDGQRRTWWVKGLQPDGKTNEDYALVTRLVGSQTSELLVAVAGVTQYGTDAASEFLTDEAGLSAALADAPADWQKKSLQFLLHLDVLGKTPGTPRVVALRVW